MAVMETRPAGRPWGKASIDVPAARTADPYAVNPPRRADAAACHPRIRELFDQHADFVHRALLRLGVPSADAEDCVQEVFMVVARRLDTYVERGALRAWLFVIARQVASHATRAERRRHARQLELVSPPQPNDPHASLVQNEALAFVNRFLAALDPRLAEVFYLAEVEQFTVPEIAAALGVKLNTVYSRLRLARERFVGRLAVLDVVVG
jgi:RNA polymerase sigma-70 factor (ECF subfamily)